MTLGLVTCHFNPCEYSRPILNYRRFRNELKHPIVTVELAFEDQPFVIEDAIHLRGDRKNLMWQKERLINLGISSLPESVDKVAWIDADLIFLNPYWHEEACKKLDEFPVVQLYEGVIDLDRNNALSTRRHGWAKVYQTEGKNMTEKLQNTSTPGGAWAIRRELLQNGIYDLGIIGAGDAYQLCAWNGRWNTRAINIMPEELRKEFMKWARKEYANIQGNIGYVPGDVAHLYHGSRVNRKYAERHQILVNSQFNPLQDIKINDAGILEWASDKPELHRDLTEYFLSRKEDE